MLPSGISQSAADALEQLTKLSDFEIFYLAGGTALALQLQHRLSFDLDFFTTKHFSEKELDQKLAKINGYKLDRIEKDTLLGNIKDTKISFFRYDNPLISKTINFLGVNLAKIPDIAAMKLEAIGSRGIKRDFVDLYFISKQYPLDDCLDFYGERYPMLKENIFHVIKSLTYFDDAEFSEMPQMLIKTTWSDIKKYFEKEAIRLAGKYL